MLTIYASAEYQPVIHAAIAQEARLDELVFVKSIDLAENPHSLYFAVVNDAIHLPLNWEQMMPPYLIPAAIPFEANTLLGIIFHLLENEERTWFYLKDTPLYQELWLVNQLRHGVRLQEPPAEPTTARGWHNIGVLAHYGLLGPEVSPIAAYEHAVTLEQSVENKAFTLREWATYCLDRGEVAQAEALIEQGLSMQSISAAARAALNLVSCKIGMQQLIVPYDQALVERIKTSLWETLQYYEKSGKSVQVAMLLLDASHVANISESYSESLGYIQRAIGIFEQEEMTEMVAAANLQKGTLLGTWAQNGNPQFFRPAVEAYQRAILVFTKEDCPDVFADIQHKLGVLYAEMPDEHKKRGIWAGVASASFQEALNYYTKEDFPYVYASICNNFANAFMKFPPALRSDNHVKAIHYYQEALEIRTAEYPYERAITLLNYLEASWNVGNDPDSFHQARFDDMKQKATEISQLVDDPDMIAEAKRHLDNLTQLAAAYQKELSDA